MQGRGMLKKPPKVRDNNGALQVRLRINGRNHFINRIGRFDDPVAQAGGQAVCAEIWRDVQHGDLDLSLRRYCPLVEGRGQDLLDALRSLAEEICRQVSLMSIGWCSGSACRSAPQLRLTAFLRGSRQTVWRRPPSPEFSAPFVCPNSQHGIALGADDFACCLCA